MARTLTGLATRALSERQSGSGTTRPPHGARRLVPAPRARLRPHARGRGARIRRPRADARGADRADPEPAAPRAAVPPAAGIRPAAAGPTRLGGRPPLQPSVTQ